MKILVLAIAASLAALPAGAQSLSSAEGGARHVEGPWGVFIAGSYSEARLGADLEQLWKRFPMLLAARPPMIVVGRMVGGGAGKFYRARIPADTRAEAEELCEKLKTVGGDCIVLKS